MGRRLKVDILSNPTEFDFELRPREILSQGFENEVMNQIDNILTYFEITNPRLNFVFETSDSTHFRFEADRLVTPALYDIVGRMIQEATYRKIRIYAVCIHLETLFTEAELYCVNSGHKEFNCWQEIEVEYKDTTDPRFKKLLKYP